MLVAAGSNVAARGNVLGTRLARLAYASRDNERFYAAGDVDESHPSVARAGKFDDVKFYQVVRLDPGKNRVVAKLTDGYAARWSNALLGSGRMLSSRQHSTTSPTICRFMRPLFPSLSNPLSISVEASSPGAIHGRFVR